ncbi:ATP-binding protein [Caballeronia sp. dw_276]|jgi:energy-coupling factor transporter ATP-binding protein EcfA2|uniref:AAA family ATPase n=1 Tax=Caballeronia sp. dw_276 TaxID=2719795 RepID=UPI001BD4080C|nr:ATP-binding protein [Caballeronia sp. dw_276]
MQEFRLTAVALKEVGVFDDVRIDFPVSASTESKTRAEVHLFTGPNGCGKSTLLYALAEIFDKPYNGESLIKQRYRSSISSVAFSIEGCYGQFGASFSQVGPLIETEFGTAHAWIKDPGSGTYFALPLWAQPTQFGSPDQPMSLGSFKNFQTTYLPLASLQVEKVNFAAFAYSGQRTLRGMSVGAIQQISNSPFEDALSFSATVRPQVLVQWIANNRTQAALARSDGEETIAASYDRTLGKLTGLIKDVCDLDIDFRLQRSPLAVIASVNGFTVPFDTLPDGLKSIISWVADLTIRLESVPWAIERDMFEQNISLFLDEIDVHLHPAWQRRILPAIQKMLPNAQIFVSTHSPFVVASVDDAWVYRLPEKGRQVGRLIKPIPSGAGKSYRLILDEVFGIDQEFDVETEALFDRFYAERDAFLNSKNAIPLLGSAQELAEKGEEVRAIVEAELRQAAKRAGVEVRLA